MFTLQQFRDSGRDVGDLSTIFKGADDCMDRNGRCYGQGDCLCYIISTDSMRPVIREEFENKWYLIIGRSEYYSNDLAKLEKILYEDWYVHECGQ
jgi:hypothetical protein